MSLAAVRGGQCDSENAPRRLDGAPQGGVNKDIDTDSSVDPTGRKTTRRGVTTRSQSGDPGGGGYDSEESGLEAVSYTHLTLPTILRV